LVEELYGRAANLLFGRAGTGGLWALFASGLRGRRPRFLGFALANLGLLEAALFFLTSCSGVERCMLFPLGDGNILVWNSMRAARWQHEEPTA